MKKRRTAKAIALVLVEGTTDRKSLERAFKRLLGSRLDLHFVVTNGDPCFTEAESFDDVLTEIESSIQNYLANNRSINRASIRHIIQLIDTDRVFAGKSETETKRKNKAKYNKDLAGVKEILGYPYRLYYMSRNLERILHGISKWLDGDEKDNLARQFQKLTNRDPLQLARSL